MLATTDGAIEHEPLSRRRTALGRFHRYEGNWQLRLSPITQDTAVAGDCLRVPAVRLIVSSPSGVICPIGAASARWPRLSRCAAPTACWRYRTNGDGSGIALLLLGLINEAGRLDHVGFTSGIAAAERPVLLERFRLLAGGAGYSGKAPGGPSRWATARSEQRTPVNRDCVVEKAYDQVTNNRFRHATPHGYSGGVRTRARRSARWSNSFAEISPAALDTPIPARLRHECIQTGCDVFALHGHATR
ncbi:hypothetical protein [Sphingomonas sp. PB4P5]|uniref:hypothetical protein n=1 Tax=Parasphingomonas puruogangriensis TaxID=3096155 RepID=UPI002FC6CF64